MKLFTVFWLYLFVLCNIQAQNKAGFKLLKARKYEDAIAIFKTNANSPKHAIGAHYGLALAYEKDLKNHHSLIKALQNAYKADSLLKSAGKKSFKTPGGVLTQYTYQAFANRHARPIWDSIKKNGGTFSDADQLRILVPSFFEKMRNSEQVAPHLKILVNQAVQKASDYATLSSIAKNYDSFLEKTALGNTGDLGNRLFNAFRRDHGPAKIRMFLTDHPKHWANRDCWKDEFIAAYEKNSLAALIGFIRGFPDSYIGAVWMLPDIQSRFSSNSKEVQELDESDKAYFLLLKKRENLGRRIEFGTLPPRGEVVSTAKQLGNGWHSYFLLSEYLQTLIENKNWEDAIWALTECEGVILDVSPARCNFIYEARSTEFAVMKKVLAADEAELVVRELEELNTEGNEIVPFITPDGKFLYFTGEGRPNNYKGEDTYRVPILSEGKFGVPELVAGLADESNESLLSINFEGNEALVYVDGILHRSQLTAKGWSKPEPFQFPGDQFSWVGKATSNISGTVLIFEAKEKSSNLYYSENIDLYVSVRQPNKQWGKPFPISQKINTTLRERSPYLHVDGKTLYFSSNGHYGLGGMDVFKTDRLDDTWKNWSEPQNMGKYINTIDDDWGMSFSVSTDGRTAFFSKDEDGRRGELMCIGLPERLRPKAIKIIEVPVNSPKPIPLSLRDRNGSLLQTLIASADAPGKFMVEEELGYVSVEPIGENNFGTSVTIDLADTVKNNTVVLSPIAVYNVDDLRASREKFQISDVRFPKSEYTLSPQAKKALDEFKRMTKGKYKIKVTGFTDDIGDDKANQILSEQRANAVKEYLVKIGYPEQFIMAEGKGKHSPKVPNNSEANRATNRRVEFEFL